MTNTSRRYVCQDQFYGERATLVVCACGGWVAVFCQGLPHEWTPCSLAVLSFPAVLPFAIKPRTEESKLRPRKKLLPTHFVGEVQSHSYRCGSNPVVRKICTPLHVALVRINLFSIQRENWTIKMSASDRTLRSKRATSMASHASSAWRLRSSSEPCVFARPRLKFWNAAPMREEAKTDRDGIRSV